LDAFVNGTVLLTATWYYHSAVDICYNLYLLIDIVNAVLRILRVDLYGSVH
jgi:hypothetical protein